MRGALVVIACVGCRLGFDARPDAVDAARAGDAQKIDAPHGDAAASCPPGALVCDGFESGDLSAWSTSDVSSNATLVFDTSIVHSGHYALHGTVAAGPSGNSAAAVETFALQSTGMIAVREWLYLPQPLIDYDGVIILEQAGGNPSVLAGGDPSGLWDVTENESTGNSVDHASTTSVVLSTWTCVELDYTFGSPSRIELYLDDALALQLAAGDPAPAYAAAYAGVARAQSGGSETIVDDVVIAAAHIGCM